MLASASAAGLDGGGLTQSDWKTLAAVQEHLFPSEPDAPGAAAVNAVPYLYFVLSDTFLEPEVRVVIPRGLKVFEQKLHSQFDKRFIDLTEVQREAALRTFEQTPEGRRWITEILGYIFEALLTDPVYGGNPGGVGWQWLAHRPGFPRPPKSKRYFLR